MNIITIWKEKGKIMEGILNYIFTREDVEDVARDRMKVCKECDKIDLKGKTCEVYGTKPCCSLCGCSLRFKTRALSSDCPEGKWESLMTQQEEDMLNENLN